MTTTISSTTTSPTGPAGPANQGSASQGPAPGLADQAGALLGHVAGYMATRVVQIGLGSGLVRELAAGDGATPDELAGRLGMDPFYVQVWCRAAFGSGVLERQGEGYALAPHVATLLLDESSPAHVGGMFGVVGMPEMFDRFGESLRSGRRLWWDGTSPEWIAAVEGTGRPFYTRLVPGGLAQVPGLAEVLAGPSRILDTACGAGVGVVRLATAYPRARVVGVDGDQRSVERARAAVARTEASVRERVRLVVSPLEELVVDEPVDLVVNNISMHECRDIDAVTERVRESLRPGGWFVISDFPFPETDEGLRSVPGRLMSGVQLFEAQIDDQLLPRAAYDDLLARHGFTGLGWFQLSPVHAVTYGRRPA